MVGLSVHNLRSIPQSILLIFQLPASECLEFKPNSLAKTMFNILIIWVTVLLFITVMATLLFLRSFPTFTCTSMPYLSIILFSIYALLCLSLIWLIPSIFTDLITVSLENGTFRRWHNSWASFTDIQLRISMVWAYKSFFILPPFPSNNLYTIQS